ncbi:hypothetical protein Purlil1_13859 [Purpureocillium lilacinum]|uniref:Uncharacterized protein n=1 Tax=Purpureocillium lilacinum TaxID=33203 RepID=A0ABR0BCX4_PURLI|nr:hypothetical protein Purlil1_13859 [Purpureocillium lilacinum]
MSPVDTYSWRHPLFPPGDTTSRQHHFLGPWQHPLRTTPPFDNTTFSDPGNTLFPRHPLPTTPSSHDTLFPRHPLPTTPYDTLFARHPLRTTPSSDKKHTTLLSIHALLAQPNPASRRI